MLTAIVNQNKTCQELVQAFENRGFPLHKILVAMLNEEQQHQGPRKGGGFTQASRFIADIINQPRGLTADKDFQLFSAEAQRELKTIISYVQSSLGRLPASLSEVREDLAKRCDSLTQKHNFIEKIFALDAALSHLELEESCLIANVIRSILGLDQRENANIPELQHLDERIAIGTCPESEPYFLEFAGGYVRRHGIMNVLVDDDNQPLMIEKVNIGDSHSCITLREVILNGILIPPGSLLGTNYSSLPIDTKRCAEQKGAWFPASMCKGFRFLRLTTLAVSPENRARAFGNHLQIHLERNSCFDPSNTTLHELMRAANNQRPN